MGQNPLNNWCFSEMRTGFQSRQESVLIPSPNHGFRARSEFDDSSCFRAHACKPQAFSSMAWKRFLHAGLVSRAGPLSLHGEALNRFDTSDAAESEIL